jgi:hypothetical protein
MQRFKVKVSKIDRPTDAALTCAPDAGPVADPGQAGHNDAALTCAPPPAALQCAPDGPGAMSSEAETDGPAERALSPLTEH